MTNPLTPTQADRDGDALVAALVILAEAGISPDTQELLVSGNPLRRVAPGALAKVLAHHAQQARLESDRRIRQLEAALRTSRGWVITCSESAQARRDLRTIDEALNIDAIRKGEA